MCRVSLMTVVMFGVLYQPSSGEELRVSLGRQQTIMPPGYLGLNYFPDQPICILTKRPLSLLMTCGDATFLLTGDSWRELTHNGKVLQPGGKGAFDNGYTGIGGVFVAGHTIYGFYHAEDHENKASRVSEARGQKPGMFSVGLAVSQDGGKTFRKTGQVLSSEHPYEPGMECSGVGDISVCVDKTNSYLLAYYADFSRGKKQGVQICMARSPVADKGMPGTWKKYNNGEFNEPGLGGRESYIVSGHAQNADAYSPHVVYSKVLDRYLMVFCWVDHSETDGVTRFKNPKASGIYLSSSHNGVDWDKPKRLFAHSTLLIKGVPGVQHPTLYLTDQRGRGVSGILLYGYTSSWGQNLNGEGTVGHYLVSRTLTINLSDISGEAPLKQPMRQKKGVININKENIDILKLIDLKRDVIRGDWRFVDGVLRAESRDPSAGAALQIRYRPAGGYVLRLKARRQAFGGIAVPVVHSGKQFGVYLSGGWKGTSIPEAGQATKMQEDFFPSRATFTITCKVAGDGVVVTNDDSAKIEAHAIYPQINGRPSDIPDEKGLYLKVWEIYEISELSLTPLPE